MFATKMLYKSSSSSFSCPPFSGQGSARNGSPFRASTACLAQKLSTNVAITVSPFPMNAGDDPKEPKASSSTATFNKKALEPSGSLSGSPDPAHNPFQSSGKSQHVTFE